MFYSENSVIQVGYTCQVTSCISPTCHTVLAVGLVIGGSTTSLNFNGTESTNNARDEIVNRRLVNATISLTLNPLVKAKE